MEKDLLDVNEVADLFEVTPQTLYVWRAKGLGPKYIKLGSNRIRYSRKAVLEYLEERQQQ